MAYPWMLAVADVVAAILYLFIGLRWKSQTKSELPIKITIWNGVSAEFLRILEYVVHIYYVARYINVLCCILHTYVPCYIFRVYMYVLYCMLHIYFMFRVAYIFHISSTCIFHILYHRYMSESVLVMINTYIYTHTHTHTHTHTRARAR